MLLKHLPNFVREYKEIKEIMNTEQEEIDSLDSEISRIKENQFFLFCDEEGIARFEKILGILPDPNDTLDSRISRVYVRWNDDLPYTLKGLKRKLELISDYCEVKINEYRLEVFLSLRLPKQIEEVERILAYMLPCNLVLNLKNDITNTTNGTVYLSSYFAKDKIYEINTGN